MDAPPPVSTVKKIKIGDWEQLWDDKYQTPYFFNVKTKQSQWDRPACFPDLAKANISRTWEDPSPVTKYIKVPMEAFQKDLLKRPARVQMDPQDAKKYYVQGTEEYNIWYDRYTGDHWRGGDKKELAETRCKMATDVGYTKADEFDPKGTKNFFCYHFAKGRCTQGKNCTFFHRIPTERDMDRFDTAVDVFGRERFKDHRQDMGGTGSVEDECTTLYVGGVSINDNTEGALWRAFGEWGTPKKMNIIKRLNIAFVTYNNRLNAEFAKVAMAGQALDGKEVLNLRWAYEDPNPKARQEKAEDKADMLLRAAERRGIIAEESRKKARLEPYSGQAIGYYPVKPSVNDDNSFGPVPQQEQASNEENRKIADSMSVLDKALQRD